MLSSGFPQQNTNTERLTEKKQLTINVCKPYTHTFKPALVIFYYLEIFLFFLQILSLLFYNTIVFWSVSLNKIN